MNNRNARWRADALVLLILVALWAAFFWRFLTPIAEDQVSLAEGDFSGQFVAFGAYQAERLWQGEVPLWNPYNNGGLPFLADTQSAVFYPPRLITVALAGLSGGWTYHALELEMMAHVLLGSLLMYVFVRRLTHSRSHNASVVGGLVAAITWSYGGFMTGYPPLQLALLEAAIWGPMILLGVHEATACQEPHPLAPSPLHGEGGQAGDLSSTLWREGRGMKLRWPWLVLSGLALGLCLMAGHPQTAYLLILLFLAFLAYRVYLNRWPWTILLVGAALVGVIAGALAAVQLLPGLEYLQHTTRIGYGFDDKDNGFPISDVIQFVFPRVLSVWSPLYMGIAGLVLTAAAWKARARDVFFWCGTALAGLGLSFGGNTVLYSLLYNALPGLRLFRGQERAAMIVALALSILAGLGTACLIERAGEIKRFLRRSLTALTILTGIVTLALFLLWLGPNREAYAVSLPAVAFSVLVVILALLVISWLLERPNDHWRQAALIALIVFDLFTVGQSSLLVEPIPAAERLTRPRLMNELLSDPDVPPYRVDGQRGLGGNFGSLWQIPDIRGISPLWLRGPFALMQEDFPSMRAWELFAVRYVITDWTELPIPSEIVAQGQDALGPVNLHRLENPRPFALLMDDVALLDSDEFAYALLADPNFDPRQSIILLDRGDVVLPDGLQATGTGTVTAFEPEAITVEVEDNPAPVILSLALPHYPGWRAAVDGVETPILRAYGGLSAVILPGSASRVELVYQPVSFALGALISLITWGGMTLFAVFLLLRRE